MSGKKDRVARIINKSKTGCKLRFPDKTIKEVTWEEFNSTFVIEDLYWAVFNPENKKRHEELEEKLNQLVAYTLMSKKKQDLTIMTTMGTLSQELCKDLQCSLQELIKLVQKRVSIVNPNFFTT